MAKQRTKRPVVAPARPMDESDLEDFATSDEEEINAAMADPKLKKLVLRHRAAFEGAKTGTATGTATARTTVMKAAIVTPATTQMTPATSSSTRARS